MLDLSDKKCVVVVSHNPKGSIADGTDLVHCGKPYYANRADWPMCREHHELFSPEKNED